MTKKEKVELWSKMKGKTLRIHVVSILGKTVLCACDRNTDTIYFIDEMKGEITDAK